MIGPFALARTLADDYETFETATQLAQRLVELRGSADRDLILIDAVWASKEEPTGRRMVAVRRYAEDEDGARYPAALIGYAFLIADAGIDERGTLAQAIIRLDPKLDRHEVVKAAGGFYTNREALTCDA